MNLKILAAAEAEIESARIYLNSQSKGLGARLLYDVEQALKAIVARPYSPFFRKFMQPILVSAKYRVTTAESAMQALKWIEDGLECNAIVTDIDMPEMDGIEFLRKFRSIGKTIPVIALSSFSNDEILAKTEDVPFDGFVSKSNRDSLVQTLSSVLGNYQQKEEALT